MSSLSRADMIRPKFYLGRRNTRWHVYPSREPLVAVAVDYRGHWAFSKHGFWYKSPSEFDLTCEVTEAEAVAHIVECVGCTHKCGCNEI